MKNVLLAAAFTTTLAVPATAGGFAATIEEPIVIQPVPEASSIPGWVIPAVIVLALIAVASSSDSGGESGGSESDLAF